MMLGTVRGVVPHIIHHLDADPVSTRYFPLSLSHNHLTPSGEYLIETEEADRTSCRLALRKLPKDKLFEEYSDGTRQHQVDPPVYLDNIACYSSRLADSYRYLLLGENDDEDMRLLIVPDEGRSLEIKPLSLTFNEAKRRLEAKWEQRQALRNKEIGKTGKQIAAIEENEK